MKRRLGFRADSAFEACGFPLHKVAARVRGELSRGQAASSLAIEPVSPQDGVQVSQFND